MTVRMQGRFAGLIYLGVVLTGIFTLAYVPGRLMASDDPVRIAADLSSNAALFGAANVAALAMVGCFLALPFALSRFLAAYGKRAAVLMILFVAASIPLSLLAIAQHFGLASMTAGGNADPTAVAAFVGAYDRWMDLASIFWGLWLAPLGWLILKSGAIPRVLGVLLILGCIGYLARYFGPILHAGYADLPFRNLISLPGSIGEIGTCLWLLIMGARAPTAN
ncbi:MAG: DUF4386 domain-containing protein [Parvularculaceae bacterium]